MDKNSNIFKLILVGVGVIGLTGATIGIVKSFNHKDNVVDKQKTIELSIGENYIFSEVNESKEVKAILNNKEDGDVILWKSDSSKVLASVNADDSYECTLVLKEEIETGEHVIITAYLSGHEDIYKNIYCTYSTSQSEECKHLNSTFKNYSYDDWEKDSDTHYRNIYKVYECSDCNKNYRVFYEKESNNHEFESCDGTLEYFTTQGSMRGIKCGKCEHIYTNDDGHLISEFSSDGKCVVHTCSVCNYAEEHTWAATSTTEAYDTEISWSGYSYGSWEVSDASQHKRTKSKTGSYTHYDKETIYKCSDCGATKVEGGDISSKTEKDSQYQYEDHSFESCDGTLEYFTTQGSMRGIKCGKCEHIYTNDDGHLISEFSSDGKCVVHTCSVCNYAEEHTWTATSTTGAYNTETTWNDWVYDGYEQVDANQHKHKKVRYGSYTHYAKRINYKCSDCGATKVEGGEATLYSPHEESYDLENHDLVSKYVGEECGGELVWFDNNEVRGVKCNSCEHVYTYDDSQTAGSTGKLSFYGNSGKCNQEVQKEHNVCSDCGYSD